MIPNSVLENIATYYNYSVNILRGVENISLALTPSSFTSKEEKKLKHILGILKIKCNKRFLVYTDEGQTIIKEFPTGIISYKEPPFKLTPYEISRYDRECIEDILNDKKDPCQMSTISEIRNLFSRLGYQLLGTDKYHLQFDGSPTYDATKLDMSWKDMKKKDWAENLEFDWKK